MVNALSNLVASGASHLLCIRQWVYADCSMPRDKGEMNATKRAAEKMWLPKTIVRTESSSSIQEAFGTHTVCLPPVKCTLRLSV
jgi:hypothetical protein